MVVNRLFSMDFNEFHWISMDFIGLTTSSEVTHIQMYTNPLDFTSTKMILVKSYS